MWSEGPNKFVVIDNVQDSVARKLDTKNKLEAQERKGKVSVMDGEDEGGNKQC